MENGQHGREDRPNNSNPDEVNTEHPAKDIKAQHKIDIVESELGREQGQTPADEHIENRLSQIDDGTKQLHESKIQQTDDSDPEGETRDSAGYMNDKTSADRDTGNDRDAGWEESRTSRHK